MLRVVYRWDVSPGNFKEFKARWMATTNHIHETVPGALGSFMMQRMRELGRRVSAEAIEEVEDHTR